MKNARAQIRATGKTVVVDAAGYVRLRDQFSKAALSLTCVQCGEPVFLNDEKGAKGFRTVNLEVAKRGQKQKISGFSHYKGNAEKDCPLYFPFDMRFQGLHTANAFDALERERNLAVLNQKNMRAALHETQRFFMQRLTGETQISEEDRKSLDVIEKKLTTMVGLAAEPWTLAYMSVVLVGSRTRPFGKNTCRIEYKGVGEQKFNVTGLDGEKRFLVMPRKIQLCFSRKDAKEPKPLLKNGRPVEFDVSRSFAHGIVVGAWCKKPIEPLPSRAVAPIAPKQAKTAGRPKRVDKTDTLSVSFNFDT